MKPVIFILADAFRFDYIEKHDLKNIKKMLGRSDTKSCQKLYPSTGFCEIIEYFTGQESDEHGMFSQITAVENWSSVKTPLILKLLNHLDWRLSGIRRIRVIWSKYILSYLLKFFLKREVVNIKYRVPLNIINRFTPTESLYKYDSYDFGGDKNVFYQMAKSGVTYDLDDFVKHNKIVGIDEDRFRRVIEKSNLKKLKDFTMFYVSAPEYAHFFGTEGEGTAKALQEFDTSVANLLESLENNYEDFDVIITGDHGMLDVTDTFDVKSEIEFVQEKYGYKLGLDYLYFIDSTVCRLWYRGDVVKDKFEQHLSGVLNSISENSDEVNNYLNQFKPKYGDSIYMIKAGKVYFPDFFNGHPNKGMHGYLNHYPGQQGCVIWKGSKACLPENEIKLSEVKDVIWRSVSE